MFEGIRRLHPRGMASRGVVVDANGAMLGPECILVSHTPQGYRGLDRDEAAVLQRLLTGGEDDGDWLYEQCQRIAQALGENDLV